VNPETVIAIAGHVGRKMMEYYAHQRTRVKYAAVMAIEPKPKPRPTTAALLSADAVARAVQAHYR
jgi:hypothetical protein